MITYTVEPNIVLQRLERKFQKKMDALDERRKFKKFRQTFVHIRGMKTDEMSDDFAWDAFLHD